MKRRPHASLPARVIGGHLAAILSRREGVLAGRGVEPLHDMRVAGRRLRNSLWMFRAFLPRKACRALAAETRRLTRSLGQARDLDTLMAFLARQSLRGDTVLRRDCARLLAALEKRRGKEQKRVEKAVRRFCGKRGRGAFERLLAAPVARGVQLSFLRAVVAERVERRLGRVLALSAAAAGEERQDELHRVRIAARRLRYTLEECVPLRGRGVSSFARQARLLQDHLGDMRSGRLWGVMIRESCGDWGLERLAARLARLCDGLSHAAYGRFAKAWGEQQRKRTWEALREFLRED